MSCHATFTASGSIQMIATRHTTMLMVAEITDDVSKSLITDLLACGYASRNARTTIGASQCTEGIECHCPEINGGAVGVQAKPWSGGQEPYDIPCGQACDQ